MCDKREELSGQLDALIRVYNTKTTTDKGVSKQTLHTSENVLIQFTKLQAGLASEIEDSPFDSEIIVADGVLEVDYKNELTLLSDKNRRMKLDKGESAKGTALKDSAVITIIDIRP